MLLRLILIPPKLPELIQQAIVDTAKDPVALQLECDETLTIHELACLLLTAYADSHMVAAQNMLWRQTADGLLTLYAIKPCTKSQVLLNAKAQLTNSGLLAGMCVGLTFELAAATMVRTDPIRAVVTVKNSGELHRHVLQPGSNLIGSASFCAVRVMDPGVPAVAACVNLLAHTAEVLVRGEKSDTITRTELATGKKERLQIGNSQLEVLLMSKWAHPCINYRGEVTHVPRARFLPAAPAPISFDLPQQPEEVLRAKLAMLPLLLPLLIGAVFFLITRSTYSVLFMILGPLLLIGNWLEKRREQKKQNKKRMQQFIAELQNQESSLAEQRLGRMRYNKLVIADRTTFAARQLPVSIWAEASAGDVSVMLATVTEHTGLVEFVGLAEDELRARCDKQTAQLVQTAQNNLNREINRSKKQPNTPYLVKLSGRQLALSGANTTQVLNALVTQLALQLSPARLNVELYLAELSSQQLQWLMVLPHCGLFNRGDQKTTVRQAPADGFQSYRGKKETLRLRVIIASATSEFDSVQRSIENLQECEAAVVIWVLKENEAAPAATEMLLDTDSKQLIDFRQGSLMPVTQFVALESQQAVQLAQRLAPLRDTALVQRQHSEIPNSIELTEILGADAGSRKRQTVQPGHEVSIVVQGEKETCVPVGVTAGGLCELDLISQGPHAMIAGTTGAGKSEFLQSWLVAMAARLDPSQLNFVLIDYKGGATFGQLSDLPHTVASVSDLTKASSERVLKSLRAEMLRRERLLAAHRCKDLSELRAAGKSEVPPLLVVAIDEFAVFVADLPNAGQTMIDLAQRGRSLGMHLILAAQRPLGSISEKIQANLQIRVCFRVANKSDSREMLGDSSAFEIPAKYPGRGLLKLGNCEPILFQAATVSETTQQAKPVSGWIRMPALGLAAAKEVRAYSAAHDFAQQKARESVKTSRLISKIALEYSDYVNTQPPVLLPLLPAVIPLTELRRFSSKPEQVAQAIGIIDDPLAQQQRPYVLQLEPGAAVLITGGRKSGKTSSLITAFAAQQHLPRMRTVYWLAADRKQVEDLAQHPQVRVVTDFDDIWNWNRALAALSAENAHECALLIDDLDSVLETMSRRAATESVERLRAAVLSFLRNGGTVMASCAGSNRIAAAMPNMFERFIYLRVADPLELRGKIDRETLAQLNQPGMFALPAENVTGQLALCCQATGEAESQVTVKDQLTHLLNTTKDASGKADLTKTARGEKLAQIPAQLIQTEAMLKRGEVGVDLLTAGRVALRSAKAIAVFARDPVVNQAIVNCLMRQLAAQSGCAVKVKRIKQENAAAADQLCDRVRAELPDSGAVIFDVSELQDHWSQQKITQRCDYSVIHHTELRGHPGDMQSFNRVTVAAIKDSPPDSLIVLLKQNRAGTASDHSGGNRRLVLLASPAMTKTSPWPQNENRNREEKCDADG